MNLPSVQRLQLVGNLGKTRGKLCRSNIDIAQLLQNQEYKRRKRKGVRSWLL